MKDYEARDLILKMTDDDFARLCEKLPEDQQKVLREMRFFHKLFNDPTFYKEVEQAVGEAVYAELRA